MIHTGRHFLQIPGPTNVPDRVLRAMDRPVIDHRGPEFARLGSEVLEALQPVFQTKGPVVIYPASGSGAWEASIVNTLSPGAIDTELPNSVTEPDLAEIFRKNYAENAIPADSFARMVVFAMSQPEDVDVNEILFRPTRQEL